jgi:hypothetical protein
MMNTKLTLRMDEDVIRGAKRYSANVGKSVSQLVEDYLAVLARRSPKSREDLPPRVARVGGALTGASLSEDDYSAYLEEKYL